MLITYLVDDEEEYATVTTSRSDSSIEIIEQGAYDTYYGMIPEEEQSTTSIESETVINEILIELFHNATLSSTSDVASQNCDTVIMVI